MTDITFTEDLSKTYTFIARCCRCDRYTCAQCCRGNACFTSISNRKLSAICLTFMKVIHINTGLTVLNHTLANEGYFHGLNTFILYEAIEISNDKISWGCDSNYNHSFGNTFSLWLHLKNPFAGSLHVRTELSHRHAFRCSSIRTISSVRFLPSFSK